MSAMNAAVAASPLAAAGRAPAPPRRPSPTTRTSSPSSRSPTRRRGARDHRVVLKNGMVVYIAEDQTLPLVNIALTVRTGGYLEPAGKEGLAALTGSQIRRGGTADPHRRAARRAARLPGRQRRPPASATPRAAPASTACATTWTSRCGCSWRCCKQPALPGGPPGAGQGAGAPGA